MGKNPARMSHSCQLLSWELEAQRGTLFDLVLTKIPRRGWHCPVVRKLGSEHPNYSHCPSNSLQTHLHEQVGSVSSRYQTHWEDARPAPRALSHGPAGRRRDGQPRLRRFGENPHPPPCPGHSLGGGQQHLLLGAHAPLPIALSWKMELLETEKCLRSFPCKHSVYSSYRAVL